MMDFESMWQAVTQAQPELDGAAEIVIAVPALKQLLSQFFRCGELRQQSVALDAMAKISMELRERD